MKTPKANSLWLPLLALLVFGLVSVAPVLGQKKGAAPKRLVWPLPPDKPRIELVTVIYGTRDVDPGKKSNFLDKVAGIQRVDFRPMFMKPYGVTTDSKGRVYVSDTGQAIVYVMDRAAKKVTFVGRTEQVRLLMPMGITVDAQDRLWVADSISQHVYVFTPDGEIAMQFGKGDELMNPTGVAVDDKRQRAYVVDSKKHAVVVYDINTGNVLHRITGTGREEDEHPDFLFPTNIVIDGQGKIYLVDTMRYRVVIFDPDYDLVAQFGSQGNRLGQFLKPKGIALDSNNNIYVVDAEFNNFQIFDPKHRLLMFLGKFGVFPGTFVLPAGIHVDKNNNIYVVDQSNARVQMFKLLDASVEEPPKSGTKTATAAPADSPASKSSGAKQ